MSNPVSIFLVILCVTCVLSQNDTTVVNENKCIEGKWYAVMGTGNNANELCNIFTNNESPTCKCLSAYFYPLETNSWEVFLYAYNSNSTKVTVDVGGCSSANADNSVLKCFDLSRAEMNLSAISTSKCFLTEKVNGVGCFFNYEMDVIGYSVEFKYMITTIKVKENSMTVIWFRGRFPGKKTYWTAIVKNLKELGIDAHKLVFYPQDNCTYPKMVQNDEMFFCQ